jgi:hypothetical protein
MNDDMENSASNKNPNFGLPGGYFQKSASSIMDKIQWLEEQKAYPVLLSLKQVSVFSVPENYFQKSELQLELVDYSNLAAINKTNVFLTPDNYFEDVEIRELSKVIIDEDIKLDGFNKQNSFKVRDDYFSKNKKQIRNVLLSQAQPTRIISLFRSRITMAAAASLVILIGLWLFQFYNKSSELKDCGSIACIDKADLLKAKNLEGIETDELYELVNDKQLEKKLEQKSSGSNKNKDTDHSNNDAEDYLFDEI